MIIDDMPQMAQFVFDFYNQKIDSLMIQRNLPQVCAKIYEWPYVTGLYICRSMTVRIP